MSCRTVLVLAKAPVVGEAKTRLGAEVGSRAAAELAAASLLDTIDACAGFFGPDNCILALAGDLGEAVEAPALEHALAGWTVLPQRGAGLAERIIGAHQDAAATGAGPLVQIGMDTPQVSAVHLEAVTAPLGDGTDAVLAPAEDGGWWALAVTGPGWLGGLADVPMSAPTTGADTRAALLAAGARVVTGPTLADVDTAAAAESVAALAPAGRFARVWRARQPRRAARW